MSSRISCISARIASAWNSTFASRLLIAANSWALETSRRRLTDVFEEVGGTAAAARRKTARRITVSEEFQRVTCAGPSVDDALVPLFFVCTEVCGRATGPHNAKLDCGEVNLSSVGGGARLHVFGLISVGRVCETDGLIKKKAIQHSDRSKIGRGLKNIKFVVDINYFFFVHVHDRGFSKRHSTYVAHEKGALICCLLVHPPPCLRAKLLKMKVCLRWHTRAAIEHTGNGTKFTDTRKSAGTCVWAL